MVNLERHRWLRQTWKELQKRWDSTRWTTWKLCQEPIQLEIHNLYLGWSFPNYVFINHCKIAPNSHISMLPVTQKGVFPSLFPTSAFPARLVDSKVYNIPWSEAEELSTNKLAKTLTCLHRTKSRVFTMQRVGRLTKFLIANSSINDKKLAVSGNF